MLNCHLKSSAFIQRFIVLEWTGCIVPVKRTWCNLLTFRPNVGHGKRPKMDRWVNCSLWLSASIFILPPLRTTEMRTPLLSFSHVARFFLFYKRVIYIILKMKLVIVWYFLFENVVNSLNGPSTKLTTSFCFGLKNIYFFYCKA